MFRTCGKNSELPKKAVTLHLSNRLELKALRQCDAAKMYEVLLRAQFHLSKSHAVNLDHFATGTTCRLAQVNVIFKRQRRDHCFHPLNTVLYSYKTGLTHQPNLIVGANMSSSDWDKKMRLPIAVQE